MRTIALPAPVAEALETICQRDGDPTLTAAATRLIMDAARRRARPAG
jgi:hypothetical protein